MSKDYKEDQRKVREALKPKLIKPGVQFNRTISRRRVVNRLFTKKGYVYGRLLGGREDRAIERIAKRQESE